MKKLFLAILLVFSSVNLLSCEKDEDGGGQKKAAQKSILNPTSEYIAVFGDLQGQTVNQEKLALYKHSLDWIEKQKELGTKINAVLQVGDITGANVKGQWDNFYYATYSFAKKIPYVAAIGDHDYTWTGQYIDHREDTFFSEYVNFPLTESKVVDYFEEGKMENVVVENYIHGQPYYFLVLEFGPRPEVIDWAKMYVGDHSWINFILINHEYLESGGGIRTKNLKCVSRLRNSSYRTPTELWEELVNVYDNILCVLSGHVGSLYALSYDTNSAYRDVPEIQHNIQEEPYNSDYWLMMWEFPVDSDSANVFIYNTKTEKYYNNKKVLFKFKYTDQPPITSVKQVKSKPNTEAVYSLSGYRQFPNGLKNRLFIKGGKKYLSINR